LEGVKNKNTVYAYQKRRLQQQQQPATPSPKVKAKKHEKKTKAQAKPKQKRSGQKWKGSRRRLSKTSENGKIVGQPIFLSAEKQRSAPRNGEANRDPRSQIPNTEYQRPETR